jgi:uncharacterized membrane protein YedE/YeeE
MTIDTASFTPWASFAGGLLIGLAAAMLLLLSGRIAGVSGIVGGMLRGRRGDLAWRACFVAGLLAAPLLWPLFLPDVPRRIDAGTGLLVIAGLLVGLGTSYGSGCTSGHGVCGVSRLSPRSLVATAAFMVAGFATVFLMRHALT